VLTYSDGTKKYAEHGRDGEYDGRHLVRDSGGTAFYRLFERGDLKADAHVYAGGRCTYNYVVCAPDDPRLLALIAQVAPVEVRTAASAPTRHRPTLPRRIGRLVLHPQALASSTATEVHPPRCMPPLMAVRPEAYNSRSAKHDAVQSTTMPSRAHMPVRRRGREEGTLVHPDNRRLVHNQAGRGGFVALPCPAHRRVERAAGCTVHVSEHIARRDLRLHSHPVPRARRPARPFSTCT
jgi:hypothetical protein